MAGGRSIQFRIESTADLRGIDQMIKKLNQLQQAAAKINQNMSRASGGAGGIDKIGKDADKSAASLTKLGNAATGATGHIAKLATTAGTAANNATKFGTATGTAANNATKFGAAASTAATGATKFSTSTNNAATSATKFGAALSKLSTGFRGIATGVSSAYSGMTRFTTSMNAITTSIAKGIAALARFAAAIASSISGGLQRATGYIRSFTTSAASMFAGLRRALDGTGNMFQRFSQHVQESMQAAQRAVKEFYSAGWSMLTSGYMAQNFGERVGRGLMGSLTNYMDYEKQLTRTAIAGSGELGGEYYSADPAAVEEMIRMVQRGNPEAGMVPVYQFSAKELAEGIYYYSSALGVPIISQGQNRNIESIGAQVSSLMALSAITGTGYETVTKGVMNIATEFGIDPRDPTNKDLITNIAAQVGMLSNISTLEVPDIFETFKMLGPMAHYLSGVGEGAGMTDMMMLTYMASEMGLRGGNVGRGFGQGFTSFIDPTDKMLEESTRWFDTGGTREGWDALFRDPTTGGLKGGVMGLIETLMTVPDNQRIDMLATLLTNNATRSFITSVMADPALMTRTKELLEGESPMRWLSEALIETNDTVSANFQNMKNAWFDVQNSIISSVEGPLKGAFKGIADVIWEVSDVIRANPWIGQLVSGIAAFVSAAAVAVGSLLMIGGTILLIMQAFSRLGAVAAPFRAIFLGIASSIMTAVPMFLLLAAVGGLIYGAWKTDFLGIRTIITDFIASLGGAEGIVGAMEKVGGALRKAALAFDDFFTGIIFGDGELNNLGAALNSMFGPLLGGAFFGALLGLRDRLSALRGELTNFVAGAGRIRTSFTDIGLAIQGFFEQVFLGTQRLETAGAMSRLGNALGIDNLPVKLDQVAAKVRQGIAQIIAAFTMFASMIRTQVQEIQENLENIFTLDNIWRAMQALGAFFRGVFMGVGAAIYGAVSAVNLFTEALSRTGDAGRWVADLVEQFTGLELSLEGVAQALGMVVGTFLGARLIGPLMVASTMIRQLGLAAAGFTLTLANVGLRMASAVAQAVLLTGAYMAQVTAVVALAGAKAVYALATATAVASAFAFSTALASIAAVALGVALVLGGIVLALGGVATAMLIQTGLTEGWAAAWQGLQDIIAGIADTFGPVVGLIADAAAAFVDWTSNLAGSIAAGNEFYGVGQAIGLALTGIVVALGIAAAAVVGFATVWAASWLASAAPVLGIVALLGTLVLAFGGFEGEMTGIVGNLVEIWSMLPEGIQAAFDKVIPVILRNVQDAMNAARVMHDFAAIFMPNLDMMGPVDLVADYEGQKRARVAAEDPNSTQSAIYRQILDTPNFVETSGDYGMAALPKIDKERLYNEALAWQDQRNQIIVDAASSPTVQRSATSKYKDAWDWLEGTAAGKFFEDAAKQFGVTPENLMGMEWDTMFGMPELDKLLDQYEVSASQFDSTTQEWMDAVNEYNQFMKLAGDVGMAEATRMYEMMGKPIPVDPGTYAEFYQDAAAAVEDGSGELIDALEEANKAVFDIMTGFQTPEDAVSKMFDIGTGQGGMSVATVLTQYGDSIMKAAGDVEWFDMNELLADAALSGQLDENVAGQNLHDALRPALEVTARQLGVSVETLMADIPKYFAPAELVPMATAEFMTHLNQIPQEVGLAIDTLGAGVWSDVGVKWTDVINYGTSMAAQNMDWDFVDFLVETYGISVQEAEAALIAAGIPFDAISDEWFQSTERLALSMNGQLQVLDAAMMEQATALANGAENMVISISESGLAELPAEVKLYLDSLGYVFVIDDTASDITNWASQAEAALTKARGVFENMMLGGGSWYPVYGETPDTTWSGYADNRVYDYQTGLDYLGEAGNAKGRQGGGGAAAGSTFGAPDPASIAAPWEAATTELSTQRQAFEQEMTTQIETEMQTLKIKAEFDFQHFSGSMSNLLTTIQNAFTGIGESMKLKIQIDTNDIKTQINSALGVATGEGAAQMAPFKVKIEPDLTEFMSWMNTIQTHFNTTGVKVKVTFEVAEDAFSFLNNLPGAPMGKTPAPNIKITVDSTEAETAISTLNTSLTNIAKTWTLPLVQTGGAEIGGLLSGLLSLLGQYAVSWTATIAQIGGVEVSNLLSGLLSLLGQFASQWTATIAVADYATGTINNAIAALEEFNNSSATATMTTINRTVNQGSPVDAYAKGGYVRSRYQLVGEEGPELVALPFGSYVNNADTTQRLFDSLGMGTQFSFESPSPSAEARAARSYMPVTADPMWRASINERRSVGLERRTSSGAPIQVHIHHLEIAKEVDVDKALRAIDEKTGRKIELVQRGMDSVDKMNGFS